MNERIDDLLSDWLENPKENPASDSTLPSTEASERIAESLLVHGLLADIGRRDNDREAARIAAVMQRIDSESETSPVSKATPSAPERRRRYALLTSALTIAVAVAVMFVLFGPRQRVSAAMASLEKVVAAASRPFDRTYTVHVVEEYSRAKRPRNLSQEAWDREAKQRIDGAKLYVRGADQFVMTVLLDSGEKRTLGCDGQQSWAFRENGPVRTSSDLNRFRGGVPGQQQDIPFLNIHAHLARLRSGYDVELGNERPDMGAQLVGVRKSRDVRGPKQVKIWFDPDNGAVHEMLLDGLPRGGGGPKSVLLKLVDQSELPADFFSHDSHHESGRRVIHE